MSRPIVASTLPLRYPAVMPAISPTKSVKTVERIMTKNEIREPTRICAKISRPVPGKIPSGCSQLMPPKAPFGKPTRSSLLRLSLYGLIPSNLHNQGENADAKRIVTLNIPATTPTLLRRKRRHDNCSGLRPWTSAGSTVAVALMGYLFLAVFDHSQPLRLPTASPNWNIWADYFAQNGTIPLQNPPKMIHRRIIKA